MSTSLLIGQWFSLVHNFDAFIAFYWFETPSKPISAIKIKLFEQHKKHSTLKLTWRKSVFPISENSPLLKITGKFLNFQLEEFRSSLKMKIPGIFRKFWEMNFTQISKAFLDEFWKSFRIIPISPTSSWIFSNEIRLFNFCVGKTLSIDCAYQILKKMSLGGRNGYLKYKPVIAILRFNSRITKRHNSTAHAKV